MTTAHERSHQLSKVAAGIAATLLTIFIAWLVYTVNQMQVTLARMDERLIAQDASKALRDDQQDRRIEALERVVSSSPFPH